MTTEAKPLTERWAELGGSRLRYLVGGAAGPPLVLVHGLGGAASNWVELAPLLAPRFRLLVPELAGHGRSDPLSGAAPTLDAFAAQVAALLEVEAMTPAVVVGHSFGGTLALRLAVSRPELVRALVLAAPAGITSSTRRAAHAIALMVTVRPGRFVSPLRGLLGAHEVLRYPALWGWQVSDPAALTARAVDGFLEPPGLHRDIRTAGRVLVAHDPRQELERVRCPTLLLWGARDLLVPVADGYEFARRLRAPIRVIADCAHLLIAERPRACADAISAFLDRVLDVDELPLEPELLREPRGERLDA
jgi:pimeloyl-ACP methyl ester carboxylesterase